MNPIALPEPNYPFPQEPTEFNIIGMDRMVLEQDALLAAQVAIRGPWGETTHTAMLRRAFAEGYTAAMQKR